ncbi:GDP-L-fucose synthase [Candidatus Pelagibacter sp.]|nr:GDP-L-fucose synthase [Candidatus Pelagibacter sp.]
MIKMNSRIFLAGHNGLVGSAVYRKLRTKGYKNIITISRKKLDLANQEKTFKFIKKIKPDFIFICAAKVGGILANNKNKSEFIYQNLQIQNNLIHGAFLSGVKRLIFLGSSCVYPKNYNKPIKESYLLKGELEKTNEPYAIAKIAGIKLCESYNYNYKTNFTCLMPTNTYGPNDNYNPNSSHFIPAMIKKAHDIKIKKKKDFIVWGNGNVKREVMYVDDLADACVFFMNKNTKKSLINIGTGKDLTINEYAKKIMRIIDVKAKIKHDTSKPNGTKRKVLDISLAMNMGWTAKTSLEEGIRKAYKAFINK